MIKARMTISKALKLNLVKENYAVFEIKSKHTRTEPESHPFLLNRGF